MRKVSFNETSKSSHAIPTYCHKDCQPYAVSMNLGSRINQKRVASKITLEGLGKRMRPEVSKQTISNWVHNRNIPNADQIAQLCLILGTSADYLVNGISGGFSPRAADIAALYDASSPPMRAKIEAALRLIDLSGPHECPGYHAPEPKRANGW